MSGAWALHTQLDLEELNARLAFVEPLGIVEADGQTTAYFAQRPDDLEVDGRWERVEDRDWNEAWKTGIEPVTVGAITIIPPWLAPPDGSDIVLVIEPAQAFGTGHHETTTGCLGALQEVGLAGRSVLDVGTGTGVLAIAAARLGARHVVASDIDPLAVTAARENATVNGASIDVVEGSVPEATFDVVVANLDTATLTAHAVALASAVHPRGTFIASGVSRERAEEAAAALTAAGLAVVIRPGREWVVLLGRPS